MSNPQHGIDRGRPYGKVKAGQGVKERKEPRMDEIIGQEGRKS
jgi:hypothetical protein